MHEKWAIVIDNPGHLSVSMGGITWLCCANMAMWVIAVCLTALSCLDNACCLIVLHVLSDLVNILIAGKFRTRYFICSLIWLYSTAIVCV